MVCVLQQSTLMDSLGLMVLEPFVLIPLQKRLYYFVACFFSSIRTHFGNRFGSNFGSRLFGRFAKYFTSNWFDRISYSLTINMFFHILTNFRIITSFIFTLSHNMLFGYINPFSAEDVLIDFTLSNARRFYSPKGSPLAVKGLITPFERLEINSLAPIFIPAEVIPFRG